MKYYIILLFFGMMIQSVYGAHEFVPIQERAQGQSLVGSSLLNDSLYTNPAASAFTNIYSVEGVYSSPQSFGASVLDTSSSGVGGGLGYFRHPLDGASDPLQGVKLSLMGRISSAVGVGVAGKALWGSNLPGVDSGLKDMDAGCIVMTMPVSFGLMVRNVFGGNREIGQPQELAAGARASFQKTVFASAAVLAEWDDLEPYQYGFGAEYVSPYHLSVKGGYRIQPRRDKSFWSLGLSFIAPRISVHYAIERAIHASGGTEHTLGVTLVL